MYLVFGIFVFVCSVYVCLRSWLCVSLYLVSELSFFVFGNCVSLYFGLCILVFGYPCMRRKKKVVVRSRSLSTSESAPPSPLHASDLLLHTTAYFFYLLLATYFFEYLLRLTAWGVRVNCTMKQVFALTHISALPRKRFLHLRVLLNVVNKFCLNFFFTFMWCKKVLLFNVRTPSTPTPTPHFLEVIRGWDWDLEAKLQSRAQGCK